MGMATVASHRPLLRAELSIGGGEDGSKPWFSGVDVCRSLYLRRCARYGRGMQMGTGAGVRRSPCAGRHAHPSHVCLSVSLVVQSDVRPWRVCERAQAVLGNVSACSHDSLAKLSVLGQGAVIPSVNANFTSGAIDQKGRETPLYYPPEGDIHSSQEPITHRQIPSVQKNTSAPAGTPQDVFTAMFESGLDHVCDQGSNMRVMSLMAFGMLVGLASSGLLPTAAQAMSDVHAHGIMHGSASDWFSSLLFNAGSDANNAVQSELVSLSPLSVAVIFGAGLVTSFSPCTLSVLPLTIGYIGGYETDKEGSRVGLFVNSVTFTAGLASTLAVLGVIASFAGKAYGQIGDGLPIAVSCVALYMGLSLLEVVPLRLPSALGTLDVRELSSALPPPLQAYLAGMTFAFAASPCSTPVLATLLAYVSAKQDPVVGGALLLAYTTGYSTPLLLAASLTGAMKRILSIRKYSAWINPVSGAFLVGGGVYSLLTRVFPSTMIM